VISEIEFHEDAEKEFKEASAFYAIEEQSLALAFVGVVEQAASRIADHPESSPLVAGRVRRIRVHRFPYAVFYSILPDRVRIIAVAYERRRPFYWRDRQ
jgi:plasmid stabilization system protein ParE